MEVTTGERDEDLTPDELTRVREIIQYHTELKKIAEGQRAAVWLYKFLGRIVIQASAVLALLEAWKTFMGGDKH